MRSRLIGLGVLVGMASFVPAARAQDAGFSDPFFLYYGFFLPRQSAIAAQPQPEDFYRAQAAQRQVTAQTDRAGLYDPGAAIGMEDLDPLRPFGSRTGSTHMVRTVATGLPSTVGRVGHSAPASHYNRTSAYYPTMRAGRGRAPAVNTGSFAGSRSSAVMPSPYSGMPRGVNITR